MTAGNDGTPENDDPFAYLYRSEGGDQQPDPAAGQPQPGMPRTSYHQVQRVGERRPQPGYGYPQQQQQQSGYGYPQTPQTQAMPQQYGQGQGQGQGQQQYGQQYGAEQDRYQQQPAGQPPYSGHRSGGYQDDEDAPSRKGLLIVAVAIVAAVAIGIAYAMTNGSGSDKNTANDKPTSAPVTSAAPTQTTPSAAPTQFDSSKVDASTLPLGGGAAKSTQWPGASASGGTYVDHMTAVGASVTWTVNVPADGPYTLFTYYGNAGDDATLTLSINGKPRADAVNLRDWGNTTDWSKAWGQHTYSWVDLKKGSNTLQLSCGQGNQCGVNLDQFELKQGQVKS